MQFYYSFYLYSNPNFSNFCVYPRRSSKKNFFFDLNLTLIIFLIYDFSYSFIILIVLINKQMSYSLL